MFLHVVSEFRGVWLFDYKGFVGQLLCFKKFLESMGPVGSYENYSCSIFLRRGSVEGDH